MGENETIIKETPTALLSSYLRGFLLIRGIPNISYSHSCMWPREHKVGTHGSIALEGRGCTCVGGQGQSVRLGLTMA